MSLEMKEKQKSMTEADHEHSKKKGFRAMMGKVLGKN
jgi:hypothetical protein